MDHHRRHLVFYALFRPLVRLFLKWRLNFTCRWERALPGPSIVLVNHTTDYDPLMVPLAYKEYLYFVASEHIYRWGLASRLLSAMFAPIPRVKGTADARTVIDVLRHLHAQHNVCIFAEGNRSFNGITMDILPSTGKLVRSSGAALVTYRIEGGYFAQPRWSSTLRRGRICGYEIGRYSAEQLNAMSVQEVNALIRRDLYEDAYARQAEDPVRYSGKDLTKGLETVLYLCPTCGKIGTLRGMDDRLTCSCGFRARYTEFGFLEGAPFPTIPEWDRWQTGELEKRALTAGDEPLLEDPMQTLSRVHASSGSEPLTQDTLRLYRDKLCCGTYCFHLSEISDMAIYGRMSLVFSTTSGSYYELKSDFDRSATKYYSAFRVLKHAQAAPPDPVCE